MSSTRRDFLKITGCLTIGFSFGGFSPAYGTTLLQELPESLKRNPNINAWLEVLANGKVRIFTGKLELGQGIRTAIGQVAAEELDLAMESVEVLLAETGRTPDEGYTAGSGSIEQSAMAVRYASAAARAKLLELAARKLGVPAEQLQINNGKVGTKPGARALTFAELLDGRQITDQVSTSVILKPKAGYRLVGKAIPRDDIGQMVIGEQVYVQDLRFPHMVHARVVRPPSYNASLLKFDGQDVQKKVQGLLKIVNNGSFLGVIAEDEFQAMQAQKLLRRVARWSESPKLPAEGDLQDYIEKLPTQTERTHEEGKIRSGSFSHKARYLKPYIMHGSIGPSCSVALWDKKILHVWTHSQGVYPLREALSKMLQLSTENIHVVGVPGSGCYGHNGADDVAADAAVLAMDYPGRHVRLQWSREEEHGWEPYGSAMIMEASAQLDNSGRITDWKYEFWSDTHSTRPGGNAENLLTAHYLKEPFIQNSRGYVGGASRNSEPYYSIPNQQIDAHIFKGPLRVSALRSLGAYANIFAVESFMDELAEKAGKDPYEFRMAHLKDERAKAVIRKLQEITKGQVTAAGTGIGIAFSRYKNSASYCAVAARVVVDAKEKTLRVQKMWAVIDAGEVINPDGLKNQTEGGLIQSASWTLREQVKFDTTHITSTDWNSYPVFRFTEVPDVEVAVLNQPEAEAMGAGEAAQGPASAAIANAIYRACGKRIRDLPILPEKLFNG
ncbi:MAG TPA: molybdopterin cofactor-binding domain-containing protein [Flavitalea sp.]|nr:molybdopterin cofactor-binding domain-containing protein [Flavitalea sp.]